MFTLKVRCLISTGKGSVDLCSEYLFFSFFPCFFSFFLVIYIIDYFFLAYTFIFFPSSLFPFLFLTIIYIEYFFFLSRIVFSIGSVEFLKTLPASLSVLIFTINAILSLPILLTFIFYVQKFLKTLPASHSLKATQSTALFFATVFTGNALS